MRRGWGLRQGTFGIINCKDRDPKADPQGTPTKKNILRKETAALPLKKKKSRSTEGKMWTKTKSIS